MDTAYLLVTILFAAMVAFSAIATRFAETQS